MGRAGPQGAERRWSSQDGSRVPPRHAACSPAGHAARPALLTSRPAGQRATTCTLGLPAACGISLAGPRVGPTVLRPRPGAPAGGSSSSAAPNCNSSPSPGHGMGWTGSCKAGLKGAIKVLGFRWSRCRGE